MSSGFQSGNVSCKDRQPDLSKQGPQRSSTGKLEGGRRSTHFPVAKLSRSRPFRRERDPAVSAASAAATALRARSRASRPGGATTPRRPRRPRELSTVALSLSLSLSLSLRVAFPKRRLGRPRRLRGTPKPSLQRSRRLPPFSTILRFCSRNVHQAEWPPSMEQLVDACLKGSGSADVIALLGRPNVPQ